MKHLVNVLVLIGVPLVMLAVVSVLTRTTGGTPRSPEPSWVRAAGFRPPPADAIARARPAADEPPSGPVELMHAALFSLAAATIHVAVTSGHLDDWWLHAVFFVAAAVFQLGWAAAIMTKPSRAVVVVGAIGNGLIALTWVVSRATGLPFGPEAWEREAVGALGVLATLFEIGAVVTALRASPLERPTLNTGDRITGWVGALVFFATAAAVMFGDKH